MQNCLILRLVGIFSVYSGDKAICQIILKGEMPMNLYQAVKGTVQPRMAAEHYGLKVNHNGMTCCPFHDDRHPSLKLNEDYYYCFGCQAHGDVIDITARLLGVSNYEAAKQLASDFKISDGSGILSVKHLAKPQLRRVDRQTYKICFSVLTDYLHLLKRWKMQYAPQRPDDEPDDRFVEACRMLCGVEHVVNALIESKPEVQTKIAEKLMAGGTIQRMLSSLLKASKEEAANGAEPAVN